MSNSGLLAFTTLERDQALGSEQLLAPYSQELKEAGLGVEVLPNNNDYSAEEVIRRSSGLLIAATRDQIPNGELFLGARELSFIEMANKAIKKVYIPEHEDWRATEIVRGEMVGRSILAGARISNFTDFMSLGRSLDR